MSNLPAVADTAALAALFPILDPSAADEIKELIESNIGPRGLTPMQFDRIKVPAGGAQMWTVQGLDGEDAVKELSGIVLAWQDNRVYYQTAYSDRGKTKAPPDCVSKDGFIGVGNPGGDCAHCPMNEWGSDPKGGRGKACKEVRRILLLRANHILPEMVSIPPTSITGAGTYFKRLADFRIKYWALITNMRLEKIANADGVDYARIIFSAGQRFDEAGRASLEPYHKQILDLMTKMDVDDGTETSHGADDDDDEYRR